jgi:hypothetical protein
MSVTVNASTSVVLVETSKITENFIVYLSRYFSFNQFVTIKDQDGFASPETPIIVSTLNDVLIRPEISTLLIEQPYGFYTLENISTGTFNVVNSYNIDPDFATANVSNLSASNIVALGTLTLIDQTNQVEGVVYSSNDGLYNNGVQVGSVNTSNLISTVDNLYELGYLSNVTAADLIPYMTTYIATGYNSTLNRTNITYSLDGAVSWSNTLGTQGFAQYGNSLTYSLEDNLFVAVGRNDTGVANTGYNQFSTDGINWYKSISPNLNVSQTRSATLYADGLYHSVGSNGNSGGNLTILYSFDGKSWEPSDGSPFAGGYALGIAYGNDVWVCCGFGPTAAGCALWSIDGIEWNDAVTTAWTGNVMYDVTFNGSVFVAQCTNGTFTNSSNICFSSNGSNWYASNSYDANFNNTGTYVTAAGTNMLATSLNTNQKLLYSMDGGVTWDTNLFQTNNYNLYLPIARGQVYKPYYNGTKWLVSVGNSFQQKWVAVGAGLNTIASSDFGTSNWTGQGVGVFTSGNAVTWNGTVFVAVGEGGNTIASSPDGYNWTGRGSSIFSTGGYGIGWNGYEFIALGSGTNQIGISSDGMNWVGINGTPVGATNATRGAVGWNGYIWVVVSNGTNRIIYSREGYSWASVTSPNIPTIGCYGIAWNGKIFVCVGEGGTAITTSPDGTTWTARVPPPPTPPSPPLNFTVGNGVAWNGSRWVAVGSGSTTIVTSTNGENWVAAATPNPFGPGGVGKSVSWDGKIWVAVGEGENKIVTSADGITWTPFVYSSLVFGSGGNGVMYSKPTNTTPIWIGTGQGANTLAVSYDGSNWQGLGATTFTLATNSVAYSGYMYVAVGIGINTIASSLDGFTWTGFGDSIISSEGYDIAWNGNLWVAVGEGTNSVATSSDGTNWTGKGTPLTLAYGVAWNGVVWCIVGTGPVNQIVTSADPSAVPPSWSLGPNSPFGIGGYGLGIAWNGTMWVAVGRGATHTIVTSTSANPNTTSSWAGSVNKVFTTEGRDVAWNGSLWVAVGEGGNAIATSTNGETWIGRGFPAGLTAGSGVAWSGRSWVVTGTPGTSGNSIAVSSDGITWTGVTGTSIFTLGRGIGYTVSELPPIWVVPGRNNASGTNGIATSIDGSNFTNRVSPFVTPADFQPDPNGFAWNGRVWLGTGDGFQTSFCASIDGGVTWISRGGRNIFSKAGTNIAWNGYMWVAVGTGINALATSTDGIFWTPRSVPFEIGLCILWDGLRWLAGGFRGTGTGTLCISSDGITWRRVANPISSQIDDIAFNGSLYVACGSGGNNFMTSTPDNIQNDIWTARGSGGFSYATGIAWRPNVWVATGGGGIDIRYSLDGITWNTPVTGGDLATEYGYGVGTNGNMFVVSLVTNPSSGNSLAWSTDGSNFNGLGRSVFALNGRRGTAYSRSNTVPVVTPGTYYSLDMSNWSPMLSNTGFDNGGIIKSFVSRNSSNNINILYQSTIQQFGDTYSISTLNANTVISDVVNARVAFISSLFTTIQNVSTTVESSSITSTINVTNSIVGSANVGVGNINYLSVNTISANTIQVRDLVTNLVSVTTLLVSTISTNFLMLNNSIISIGSNSGLAPSYGRINPGEGSVALGTLAGNSNAGAHTVSIGAYAGAIGQSTASVAIGVEAGRNTMGPYSVAIGPFAGTSFLSANSIVINASTQTVNSLYFSSFYVNPIGVSVEEKPEIFSLYYDNVNSEIKYGLGFSSDVPSTFSTLLVSSVQVNSNFINPVPFEVNGPANIGSFGRNFSFGVSSVNNGISFEYDRINIGRCNAEVLSGRGTGSRGWIDFYTGVADTVAPAASNLSFTIAQSSVGVNVSTPRFAMDIAGSLQAFSTISTVNTFVSSINGLPPNSISFSGIGDLNVNTFIASNTISTLGTTRTNFVSTNSLNANISSIKTLWVTTGTDIDSSQGTLRYSTNGSNWSNSVSGGFVNTGNNVAFNGSMWVAVGAKGSGAIERTILYSSDGSNWNQSITGGFATEGEDVAWNGNMWVAVGDGGGGGASMQWSVDGSNWNNATSGFFSSKARGIAANNSTWVAVGDDGTATNTIKYSTDGSNWTSVISGGFVDFGNKVAWNGSYWIAVGRHTTILNTIQRSTDATNWSPATTGGFTAYAGGLGIAWGGNLWVAVGVIGDTGGIPRSIQYSSDGQNWTNVSKADGSFESELGYDVAWSRGMWIAVGDASYGGPGASTKYSFNGTNWFNSASGAFSFSSTGVGAGSIEPRTTLINRPKQALWVAVGEDGNTIKYSSDGINWNNASSSGGGMFSLRGYGVAWNGSLWVAVGDDSGGNTIKYSYDGINWNNASSSGGGRFSTAGVGVAWNGSLWVAVGYDGTFGGGNTIKYSSDGINWNNASSSGGGMFSSFGRGVAWNGSLWVAVGDGGGNTIKYSYDGITWNNASSSGGGMFTGGGDGVAWNGSLWVAVGFGGLNTIKYSYDGINWNNASSSGGGMFSAVGEGVAWNGSLWVAVGAEGGGGNTIKYSSDGINWNNASSSVGGMFSGGGRGVAWNGSLWVAVGVGGVNTIKYSYDGINWNNASSSGGGMFSTAGNGVAYSQTITPDISTSNLDFYLQAQPTYINTKNQILGLASSIVLNNTVYINRLSSFVGVNTPNPQYPLHVVGNMRAYSSIIAGVSVMSNSTQLATSDSNIKENIQFADLNRCLEIVEQVPLKHFNFIPEYQNTLFDKSQIGFLAQDIEQVFPNATLSCYSDNAQRDVLYLSKDQIYMAHYGATQKLIEFIEYQTCEISTLYSRIDSLEGFLSTSTNTNNI